MSAQFYLGSVDIAGWHQLGAFTIWNPDTGTQAPWVCTVNNRLALFWPMNGNARDGRDKGFVLVLFDEDGSTCVYKSPDYAKYGTGIGSSWSITNPQTIFQAGNTFQWQGNNGTYTIQVPTTYVKNGSVTIPYPKVAIPPAPCGVGAYNSTTFVDNGGFIAHEYLQIFGENNNYYAVIMKNKAIVGQGFIGNAPGNQDPFIRYQQTLPPNVQANDLRYKNGAFTYNTCGNSVPNRAGATSLRLNGPFQLLVCGHGTDYVYIDAASNFDINISDIRGQPTQPFYSGNANAWNMSCDIPYTYCTPINNSDGTYCSFSLFNPYQWLDIRVVLDNSQALFPSGSCGIVSATKRAYVAIQSNDFTFTVWSAPLPSLPGPPPNMARSQFDGLVNYHRAVSPRGTFQA